MTSDQLQKLSEILSTQTFRKALEKGESLIHLGTPLDFVYLLESGKVRALNYTAEGDEISFFEFEKGNLVNWRAPCL